MAKNIKFDKSETGRISYTTQVVRSIVMLAISEVEGVAGIGKEKNAKDVNLRIDESGLEVDVYIKILYGHQVMEVAYKIQESVKRNVEIMTQYKIAKVNVFVSGVAFQVEEK